MRVRRRSFWRTAAAVAVAAGVIAGVTVWGALDGGAAMPSRAPEPTSATSAHDAHAACLDMKAFQQLVQQNGSATDVQAYLRTAVANITMAADRDQRWLSLQSGIASVQRGVSTDDADASQLGIAIVRDQCRQAGVSLVHFPGDSDQH